MKAKRFFRWLIIIGLWFLLWEAAYLIVDKEILIASPQAAFFRLFQLAKEPNFWQTATMTLARILSGYGLGVVCGCLLAVFTARFTLAKDFFSPLLNIIKATPVASFILLALLWINTGRAPAFISFLIVLPLVWSNVYEGLKNVDRDLLEMGRSFRLGKKKMLMGIYIPSVLPYFMAAATTGMGLAWKSGVAAEVIATPHWAIGSALYDAKIYLETVDLFAWTIMVIILSLLLEKLLLNLVAMLSRKYHFALVERRAKL